MALRDVDTNVEREAKQPKTKKRNTDKQRKPKGRILSIAEFDEEQRTTREEMCRDLKHIVHAVTKWRNKYILQ